MPPDPVDDASALAHMRSLAARLEAAGIDATGLRALEDELAVNETPPGFFGRLARTVRSTATRQWQALVGELRESGELMVLITRALREGPRALSPEERDKVRAQLLDLVRVAPAGLFAAANSALPVPGTSVFTPWVLTRLGLMPTRWREAHLLAQLAREAERLREARHPGEAAEVEALAREIEAAADAREQLAQEADLLTCWDANGNGVWDDDERQAYHAELVQLRALARKKDVQRRWYLRHQGAVFGPCRLTELQRAGDDMPLLVCYDGKSGWVALADLLPPARDGATTPDGAAPD